MLLTITTGGSRGDLQPFLALGLGLKAAGHEVRLAAHPYFEEEVRGSGLVFRPLRGPNPPDETRTVASGAGGFADVMKRYSAVAGPNFESVLEDCLEACSGADAVVYTTLGFFGVTVARALGVPSVGAALSPISSRTRHLPSAVAPPALSKLGLGGGPVGRAANATSYALVEQLFWRTIRRQACRAIERVLGAKHAPVSNPLRELERRRQPVLHGWSEAVVPRPADWPPWMETTGYWFLGARGGWRPPPGLADFLEAGTPPVCVGFGSMAGEDPERTTDAVVTALVRARRRGVLLTGWGGITNSDLPDEVFKAEHVPHDWLFGRVALAVHHGGAGTTAAAFRAGVPQVVVPFFGDQHFWGLRAENLGVAPAPLPVRRLSPRGLALAIGQAATDFGMGRRARAIGEKVRAEDGVRRGVEALERHLIGA